MARTQTATEPATEPARRGGRPPLSESRKDEIRLEIAIAAVRLFTAQGLDGTSVAQIADAAGIATRTLWRYFPSKEACAGPLLSFGLDRFTSYVRDLPADRPLVEAADDTRWFSDAASPTRVLLVIDLLRLTHTALRVPRARGARTVAGGHHPGLGADRAGGGGGRGRVIGATRRFTVAACHLIGRVTESPDGIVRCPHSSSRSGAVAPCPDVRRTPRVPTTTSYSRSFS
jgi:AcrR family transcriptional regulator